MLWWVCLLQKHACAFNSTLWNCQFIIASVWRKDENLLVLVLSISCHGNNSCFTCRVKIKQIDKVQCNHGFVPQLFLELILAFQSKARATYLICEPITDASPMRNAVLIQQPAGKEHAVWPAIVVCGLEYKLYL